MAVGVRSRGRRYPCPSRFAAIQTGRNCNYSSITKGSIRPERPQLACVAAECAWIRGTDDRTSGCRRHRNSGCGRGRNRYPGAARPAAVGPLPHAGRGRARHHLDSRRPRGDAGRLDRRRAEGTARCCTSATPTSASPAAPISPARCSAHSFFGWLTDRLGRKKLFFITLAVYLLRHRGDGAVVEFRELRAVPLPHRRRHRRRIRRDQFDHPGADPGARARLDRSRRSTAASGSARRSARSAPSCCSIRRVIDPGASAGGWPS